MSDITYTARQDSPESIRGFEQYQDADTNLISSYQVNNLFDVTKNFAQVHILDLADTLLESRYNYTRYTLSANAQSAGKTGASILTISPIQDALAYGYSYGGVKLLYHFLSDLYTEDNSTLEFYIDRISEDRKELSLLTQNLAADEIDRYTQQIKARLTDQSDFSEFRLDFKDNNLFIGVNIDTLDTVNGKSVVVKLYEPLPTNYTTRSTLNILETISDSVAYELDYEVEQAEEPPLNLRPANFNIDISEQSIIPTQYLNYDELLSYRVDNANSEIYSILNEKGIEISIDYTDYSTFIHFSSAQERLLNFKYKVDLLAEYTQKMDLASTLTSGAQGISGSRSYYENLYQGIINNFDHYERFLYYESGSSCWPKSNTAKPYINIPSKDPITNVPNPIVASWYNEALTNSIAYDRSNYSILSETIPTYLRDDDSNVNYITFIYMLGQHFDNLWVYGKAVTDKYDADNRLDFGISKDLVGEALKNFGVKLYTSNKSIEDLFGTFIGQSYQSGSEYIATYVTGSLTGSNAPIQPSSFDDYQKDIQKRIYHNLPLLLKSKGTERGLRALINCFGIPSDILQIKLYGGRNVNERPFFGDYQHYTSSLDKIRLDHTGSLIPGNTLSENTSTVKKSPKYTDDLHTIEVGFSPSDNIDNYILSNISASFNIDQYIGDPRNLTSANYDGLFAVAESILANLDTYNLQDYVRLIKFFDNVIFKMVKDFIPARAVADTGIIIKPNLLNRSKAKSVTVEATSPQETENSAIIDTAFVEGSDGGIYDSGSIQLVTGHLRPVTTPQGISWKRDHEHEEAKYNGELYNSEIVVTDGELEKNNPYLNPIYPTSIYNVGVYPTPPTGLCTLAANASTQYVTVNTTVDVRTFFANENANTQFSIGPDPTNLTPLTTQTFSFGNQVGQSYYIQAVDPDSTSPCIKNTTVITQICSVLPNNTAQALVSPGQVITLANYFNNPLGIQIDYYVNGNPQPGPTYTVPTNAIVTGLSQITITAKSNGDTCSVNKVLTVSGIVVGLSIPTQNVYVTTLDARITVTTLAGNTPITEKGIVWSNTNTDPTVGGAGCTKLTSPLPTTQIIPIYPFPLTPNTQYYLKAYVTTALGTVYSNIQSATTKELGTTTLTQAIGTSTITFTTVATNPAFLPIIQLPFVSFGGGFFGGGTTTTLGDGYLLEFTSPDSQFVNLVSEKKAQLTQTQGGLLYTGTTAVSTDILQSNTNYRFKAKVSYKQGNTPYNLQVTSSALPYFVPALQIGDTFQGGKVFSVVQRGNSSFMVNGVPTRRVLVLNPSDYPGTTGNRTTAINRGEIPPNFGGYGNWRLPTYGEQQLLHDRFPLLGSAGTSLQGGKIYWNSNSSGYTGMRFTSTSTPPEWDSETQPFWGIAEQWYVRSVRTSTQTVLSL